MQPLDLNDLQKISSSKKLSNLSKEELTELQTALKRLALYNAPIDGMFGVKTQEAWHTFKEDNYLDKFDEIGSASIKLLRAKVANYQYNFATSEGTKQAIIIEAKKFGFLRNEQLAYILATVQHETAGTFKPVKEAFWMPEEWRKQNLRYWPYVGRGYVQITWKSNYEKYGKLLGLDLVNKPDIAMKPEVALFILIHGFKTGAFTGRKLTDYVNEHKTDFVNARRCINGTDKARQFANTAENYLKLLNENKL